MICLNLLSLLVAQENVKYAKFRCQGLEFRDDLDFIFGETVEITQCQWTPTLGVPIESNGKNTIDDVSLENLESDDDDVVLVENTKSKKKTKVSPDIGEKGTRGKTKVETATTMKNTFERLVQAIESHNEVEKAEIAASSHVHGQYSIPDCVKILKSVKEDGLLDGQQFIYALEMLKDETAIAFDYHMKYLMKQGNKDLYSHGWTWVRETLNTPDGTHISTIVPTKDQIRYIGRKGYPTQNVMLVCNLDMLFTFVVVGWPDIAHDTRILSSVIEEMKSVFPHPPEGKYYLVDAEYPNMKGYLSPYKGERSFYQATRTRKKKPQPPKSFAQAVSNVCEIPLSQLPKACVKGDRLAISIPKGDYVAGLDACKHNLHGRIIWPKGATPLTVSDLKSKLSSSLWKDLSKFGVSSLGKGYYEFVFSTLEDVRRVRSIASWNLNPGILKLFTWSKDFNPRVQQNISAQVWVRFYGLSQEYWRPMIERTFGQFVRVLVDMDLSQTLRDKLKIVGNQLKNPPKSDGRVIKEKENEIIIVESDKVEVEPVNLSNSAEVTSKHNDTDKMLEVSHKASTKQYLILLSNKSFKGTERSAASLKSADEGNVDEVSSQGSQSFVDATQNHSVKSVSEGDKGQSQDNNTVTPENVKKDMDLLKDSWANMAENEEEEERLLQYLDKTPSQPCMYWNTRGLANSPTRLALKSLNLNPLVLASDEQQVTFCITENNKTFALTAIYAATTYLKRRKLWNSLNILQSQHALPWCFLGDFNAILGAHEHRGRVSPARLPMEDFQKWTDEFNLIHLPTTRAEFAWMNDRRGLRYAERRLDRAVCNQA
ncbi:hypothetical protein TSUD_406710 [Trifolium subterraneum]|uniref:DDE Tnp4 domain-containing protein n=1 Tax=Trifolium subterraneum TaxID=3900 RepID=A0A2Z6P339_TRISU|nr:hypothetical protein TSUD_406710 [Trifolium subterraneum]